MKCSIEGLEARADGFRGIDVKRSAVALGQAGEVSFLAEEREWCRGGRTAISKARLANNDWPCLGSRLLHGRKLSLPFAWAAFDFDGHHRLVVEGFNAGGVLGDGAEDVRDHAIRRLLGASGNNFLDAFGAKRLAMTVTGVENTVAEEHEHVAGLGFESELVVVGFVEQAEWKSSGFDGFNFAVVAIERERQARIGHEKRATLVIPYGIDD